jgi:molybdenum cofactor cytidylyltransferase
MIVGVLLAAGCGRRFGGDKLLAELGDGRKIAEISCVNLHAVVDRLIAVVRPDDDALAVCLSAADAEVCVCPDADKGMGASLACGVRQAADADGWLIALAEMPLVSESDIRRVADALRTGAAIAVPVSGQQRGHPVGFSRRFFGVLSALTGDIGARAILERHVAEIVAVPVVDSRTWHDIDTTEDLAAAKQAASARLPKR